MWVILYLAAVLGFVLIAQNVVRAAFREPFEWSISASSDKSKKLKYALKFVLQFALIGSILLFPYLVGSSISAYFGPLFRTDHAVHFLYGEVIALILLGVIYGVELVGKWIYFQPRYPASKALVKSSLSGLSSLTVVSVEEPFFRGIVLQYLLYAAPPAMGASLKLAPVPAIVLGAVLFSVAHFLRPVRTYWPSVGLAVLGIWMGVAFYKTGSLWLSMGLHSGGILSIGIHRCFLNYRERESRKWEMLVGTQTYPIAGAIAIAIMLIGSVVTWFLF